MSFSVFCLLIAGLFRLFQTIYIVPVVYVSPDAAMRFANSMLLFGVAFGFYVLAIRRRKDKKKGDK